MDRWGAVGGSLALGQLIDEHGAALYADLYRHYGVDLTEVVAGRSGPPPRMLLTLVERLPEDSGFVTALRGGPQYAGWDVHAYLAALLVDAVNHVGWVTAQVNSRKRLDRPKPVPRPDKRRRPTTVADIRRRFGAPPSPRG